VAVLEQDVEVRAEDVVDEVARAAEKMLRRLNGRIVNLKKQMRDPSEIDGWMNKGNGLKTLPKNQWRKGMEQVEVQDWSQCDEDGQPATVVVDLDPKKDFQENARACFKQAKKITNSIEKVGPMVEEAERKLEMWQEHAEAAPGWLSEVGSASGLSAETRRLVLDLHSQLLEDGVIKPKAPPAPAPDPEQEKRAAFRRKYGKDIDCYLTPGGFEVVAGRSRTTNDYVSTKLAKNDMPWFHTDNGIPGSHVLIRAPWDEVSEEDFEFAAKLAAYHSKAKDGGLAPVMYCKGGDVRKPRGARPGQVTCVGKTFSMMVKPALPPDA
jgi:predicted ribosome quality control (RQC) complex YloA/Tae2 family protein